MDDEARELRRQLRHLGFIVTAPLSEAFIASFETQHRIRLPADYRLFVTTVANGGAGPGYGILRFGESDNGPWQEGDGFVGVLAKPFPYTAPWNDYTSESEYFAPVDGAIPICHLGCAFRIWLIVSGLEAGNLWQDDRASDGGWEPLGQPRIGFLEWYRHWLGGANRGEDVF
jgi:hypothetical protein